MYEFKITLACRHPHHTTAITTSVYTDRLYDRGHILEAHQLLTMQNRKKAIYIADDAMVHIIWQHATLCLNVTGLIYLIDFLDGNPNYRNIGFEAYGNMDDGFEIWVQNVGLRLSTDDCYQFKQLLVDGLASLRTAKA